MRIYDNQPLFNLSTADLIRLYDYYEERKITGQKKQAIHNELHQRGYVDRIKQPKVKQRGSACAQAQPPAYDFSAQTTEQLQKRLRLLLQAQRVTDETDAQAHAIDRELKQRYTNDCTIDAA